MNISSYTHTWYGALLFVIVTGHLTIMCTSLYLHRMLSHRSVTFHPAVSLAMRLWLWIFTAIGTKEWVSVHRKHHAFVETEDDPHSPVIHGWAQILFLGLYYYRKAYSDPATIEKYSKGCPDDAIERKIFTPMRSAGLFLLLAFDLAIFGFGYGSAVWIGQILWVPFWAAGIVNGIGHTLGYRNYSVEDASRNIIPTGLLLSGEELHNNHHKFPSSAKFSKRWFEIDMGWGYIQLLRVFGLAKVNLVQHAVPNFKQAALSAKEAAIEKVHEATIAAKDAAAQAKSAVKVMTKGPVGSEI
ncbi:MAG TPA: fatty acid desaturase [Candidatus Kapabacteria bacterium]|jgi:stearoyl-CoA desaturase (delta-9 desaturase)